jgi:uncharacterized protein (TIGR00369 family)
MPVATALDAVPTPPCARLLGWRVLAAKPKAGWIKVGFDARWEFTNPAGYVQGGFLAAMLDDTMGPAVFVMTEGKFFPPTIDMHVSFLSPTRPGRLVGEGRVVQLGSSIAFIEGVLFDAAGAPVARAAATAKLVAADRALADVARRAARCA